MVSKKDQKPYVIPKPFREAISQHPASGYDADAVRALATIYGIPQPEVIHSLGLHVNGMLEKINRIKGVQDGWKLWNEQTGAKESKEVLEELITDLLEKELETKNIPYLCTLQSQCPEHKLWCKMIRNRKNRLCRSALRKNHKTMSLNDGAILRRQCEKGSRAHKALTKWIDKQIGRWIGRIPDLNNGLAMWKICDPKSYLGKTIEKDMADERFQEAIDKLSAKEVREQYISLPDNYFEALKSMLMLRHYEIISETNSGATSVEQPA